MIITLPLLKALGFKLWALGLSPMALLIFLSAATGTGIISALFSVPLLWVPVLLVLKVRNSPVPHPIIGPPGPAPAATSSSFLTFILLISVFFSWPSRIGRIVVQPVWRNDKGNLRFPCSYCCPSVLNSSNASIL